MKVFFLFVFLYIFFVGQTYLAFGCEETFRRYAYNDADQLVFLRNFQKENVSGENVRFIVIQDKLTVFIPLSIAEIIEKTDEHRLRVKTSQSIVYEMDIEKNGSFSFISGDRKLNRWIKQGNPELKEIFEVLSSTRKKITSNELNLPPKTKEEKLLREQGYGPAYTRGIDESNEWIAVAKGLRNLNANAYITHIEYFADKIPEYIEYIRKAVMSLDLPGKREKLDKIRRLEKQAKKRLKDEGVTYSWWVQFNYELVSVIGSSPFAQYDISAVVSFFPLSILMPTVIGEVGIMAINRMGLHGVDPVGMVTDYRRVDAMGEVSPQTFFVHDIGHAISRIMKRARASYNSQLYEELMEMVKSLPVEKRKNMEFAYFMLMHEVRNPYINVSPQEVGMYISRKFSEQIRTGVNFKGIINFDNADIIGNFVEVYSKVMEDRAKLAAVRVH